MINLGEEKTKHRKVLSRVWLRSDLSYEKKMVNAKLELVAASCAERPHLHCENYWNSFGGMRQSTAPFLEPVIVWCYIGMKVNFIQEFKVRNCSRIKKPLF